MARHKAFAAVYSPDGKEIHYTRGPDEKGLFRAPAGGGEEQTVMEGFRGGMWGDFALSPEAIYHVEQGKGPGYAVYARKPRGEAGARMLFEIERPVRWDRGLSISPDFRTLYYAQVDRSDSDLFLLPRQR